MHIASVTVNFLVNNAEAEYNVDYDNYYCHERNGNEARQRRTPINEEKARV